MKNTTKNQQGYAILESLLILVIIAVIGGVGWYAFNSKNKTDKILSQADKISQSTPVSKQSSNTNTNNQPTKQVPLTLTFDDGQTLSFNAPDGWTAAPGFKNKVQRTIGGKLYVLSAQINDQDYLKLENYQSNFNAIVGSAKAANGTTVSIIKLDPNNGKEGDLALSSCEPDQSGFGCSLSLKGASLLVLVSGSAGGQSPEAISFSGTSFNQYINELQQAIRTMPL